MSTAPKKKVVKKATPETNNEAPIPTPDTTMSEVDFLREELKRKDFIMDEMRRAIVDLSSKTAPIKEKIEKAIEKVGDILENFEYQEGLEILAKTRKVIMRQAEDKCADSEKAVDYFRNLRSY